MERRRAVEAGEGDVARLPADHGRFRRRGDAGDGRRLGGEEYECSFTSREGLVYPDFADAVVRQWPSPGPEGRGVGGIDFGWRNPFAALCGVLDGDDVLWIGWERFCARRRCTCTRRHCGNIRASSGTPTRPGAPRSRSCGRRAWRCAAPTTTSGWASRRWRRLRTGRLKVHGPACPELLAEARLYRYPTASEARGDQREPGGRV